jgi:hypothetical protein
VGHREVVRFHPSTISSPASRCVLAIAGCLLVAAAGEPANTQLTNGAVTEYVQWRDTSGKVINVHDGGVLYANGRYYWYGQSLGTGAATTVGVVMYSSTDLYNWTYEGVILPVSTDPASPLRAPMRMERPKIVYNAATDRFVLWFHYVGYPGTHATTVGKADAGVASCSTVNGTYTFHGFQRPEGSSINVKDSTLFVDTDGTAYFVHASKEDTFTMYVDRLTADYRHAASFTKLAGVTQREAPALLKRNGYYFLFTSGVTSWTPNRARYYRATSPMGPYASMGDPCLAPNNDTTYNSQSTYIFPVSGKNDAFILMTERHDANNIGRSSFIWLPIRFPTSSSIQIQYLPTWDLGYFGSSPTPTPTATPAGSYVEVTPTGAAVTASTHDGNLPANVVDGSLATRWSASGDGQWLQLDLGAERTLGYLKVAVYNGNARRNRFDLQVSTGGGVWQTVWSGESSGTTTAEETYDFTDISARWVRYLGHMNSVNSFNSVTEVSAFAVP